MIPRVLVRVDDIGAFDKEKDSLILALCSLGIRVCCSVVPTWLTTQCIDYLEEVARLYPGFLEINQHGYSHANYSEEEEQYEFGPLRTLDEQKKDIAAGFDILSKAFGSLFFPGFTPPFGTFDSNTLLALRQTGFRVLSTFASDDQARTIAHFSPDIDCFRWHPTREKYWEEITAEWRKESASSYRGFILHPRFMSSASIALLSRNLPLLFAPCQSVTFAQLLSG